jgi:hypothetical protein
VDSPVKVTPVSPGLTGVTYTGESRLAGVAYTGNPIFAGVAYTSEFPSWLNNSAKILQNFKSSWNTSKKTRRIRLIKKFRENLF